MTLTHEQRQFVIEGIAYQVGYLRGLPTHEYQMRQESRNVIGFLTDLLRSAEFGDQHETNAVPPELVWRIQHTRSWPGPPDASPLTSDPH